MEEPYAVRGRGEEGHGLADGEPVHAVRRVHHRRAQVVHRRRHRPGVPPPVRVGDGGGDAEGADEAAGLGEGDAEPGHHHRVERVAAAFLSAPRQRVPGVLQPPPRHGGQPQRRRRRRRRLAVHVAALANASLTASLAHSPSKALLHLLHDEKLRVFCTMASLSDRIGFC